MSLKSSGTGKPFRECDMVEIDIDPSMQEAVQELEARQKEKPSGQILEEQTQTAIRQFLLFLIFFMVASVVIFRNPLARWLLSLDETLLPQNSRFGQHIRDLSDDTQRQNQLLDEIGYGSNKP